uniref:Phenoloxidase 1-like n=1 Tax=Diabrotica virgifera virgifera TaxID=50390 RepID=A0A6P7FJQ8_DIAVI
MIYNFERLCHNMKRTERFINWRQPIKEAYFPKLDSLVSSRAWPSRVADQTLSNLKREVDQITLDVDDLERWRDRIFEAIQSGKVKHRNGQIILLDEATGIDTLGNMVESSILSPNRDFYGDIHNMGHVFTSYIHDPDHRHLVSSFRLMKQFVKALDQNRPCFEYLSSKFLTFSKEKFKAGIFYVSQIRQLFPDNLGDLSEEQGERFH